MKRLINGEGCYAVRSYGAGLYARVQKGHEVTILQEDNPHDRHASSKNLKIAYLVAYLEAQTTLWGGPCLATNHTTTPIAKPRKSTRFKSEKTNRR